MEAREGTWPVPPIAANPAGQVTLTARCEASVYIARGSHAPPAPVVPAVPPAPVAPAEPSGLTSVLLDPQDTSRPPPVVVRYFFEGPARTVVVPYRDDEGALFVLWMGDDETPDVEERPVNRPTWQQECCRFPAGRGIARPRS